MKITTLYFAQIRDRKKIASEELLFETPLTVQQLFDHVFKDDSNRDKLHNYVRIAVNQEYTGWDTLLADGDEVVFIPPVAGG